MPVPLSPQQGPGAGVMPPPPPPPPGSPGMVAFNPYAQLPNGMMGAAHMHAPHASFRYSLSPLQVRAARTGPGQQWRAAAACASLPGLLGMVAMPLAACSGILKGLPVVVRPTLLACVRCPAPQVGAIIGRGGQHITQIRQMSGARVQLPAVSRGASRGGGTAARGRGGAGHRQLGGACCLALLWGGCRADLAESELHHAARPPRARECSERKK